MPKPIVPPPEVRRIYLVYPRHVKPQEAYRAIASAIDRLKTEYEKPGDWLYQRTSEYAEAVAAWATPDSRKFIPYPATWFNGDRFREDPVEWRNRVLDRRSEYSEDGRRPPRTV